MKLDSALKIRIFSSAIIISALILMLKITLGRISSIIPIGLAIFIPAILIRTYNLKDAIIIGVLVGILGGLILSIFFLALLFAFTLYLILFCIIGMLFSYYISKNVIGE